MAPRTSIKASKPPSHPFSSQMCRLSITKLRQKGFNYLLPLDKWVPPPSLTSAHRHLSFSTCTIFISQSRHEILQLILLVSAYYEYRMMITFFSSERSSLHYFPPLSNATVSQQSASGQIEVTFLHCVFFSDMCQSTGWPATSSSSTPSYTLVPTSQTLVLTIITFMITTLHYIINDHALHITYNIYWEATLKMSVEKPRWKTGCHPAVLSWRGPSVHCS